MNKVLDTTKYVADHSALVSINHDKIPKFAWEFMHLETSHWLTESPMDFRELNDEDKLNFLITFNSISFSYWGKPKWTVEYNGESYDGSWAMMICIERARSAGKPILDANYRANITKEDFEEV